jgi:hypothetical protein
MKSSARRLMVTLTLGLFFCRLLTAQAPPPAEDVQCRHQLRPLQVNLHLRMMPDGTSTLVPISGSLERTGPLGRWAGTLVSTAVP